MICLSLCSYCIFFIDEVEVSESASSETPSTNRQLSKVWPESAWACHTRMGVSLISPSL